MLVLALQFSKGVAGAGIVGRHEDETLTWHAVAAELEGSCRARGSDRWSGSLKTKEKTKCVDSRSRGGTNPTTLFHGSTYPPVHQLGTGSNRAGRMPAND